MQQLESLLRQIDRKGYKAYKQLVGDYQFPHFLLRIDHVQGDPFADPSRCRAIIEPGIVALSPDLYSNASRRIALEDCLGRRFADMIKKQVQGARGSGKSGEISIASYGQQVLERNAVLVHEGQVEVRFQLALPADGRSVNARQASIMLFEELPQVVDGALLTVNDDMEAVRTHIDSVENQCLLRQQLESQGLVAFIADNAILPRASGVDDHPLAEAVPFQAPEALAVTLKDKQGNSVRGLGVRRGVTLIVGGGFHGKSTLLHAMERGVYDHIPGDGREQVVADPSAFKVRAEDGRAITGVDISPFITNLPQGKDTVCFSTENASGSTSQAANIMEALATETHTLLIDEDTSATNFMIRDQRMQALVHKEKEPITPLVQRIRDLYRDNGVSVVLVMGGSGDFFGCADTVIMMDNYLPRDVSREAQRLAQCDNATRHESTKNRVPIAQRQQRHLLASCLDARYHRDREKIQALGTRYLRYGREEIDVSRVEQLIDNGQLQAVGYLMNHLLKNPENHAEDLVCGLRRVLQQVEERGLDSITPYIVGTLALPRLQELVATVNRFRRLQLAPDKLASAPGARHNGP